MHFLRAVAQIVQRYAEYAAEHGKIADPFRGTLPEAYDPGNSRIFRQAAVGLGIVDVVQNVDDASSAYAGRIVDSGFFDAEVFAQLFGASFGEIFHVIFG